MKPEEFFLMSVTKCVVIEFFHNACSFRKMAWHFYHILHEEHGTKRVKMDLKETGHDDVDWIHLAEERIQWWAFVNMVMNL
jgi:hypothetical protein